MAVEAGMSAQVMAFHARGARGIQAAYEAIKVILEQVSFIRPCCVQFGLACS